MSQDTKPLFNQQMELPFRAVLVRCLNEDGNSISSASGFVRREGGKLWLYTCWHVVTGYDRNDLKVGNQLPDPAFLEINMQDAQKRQPGIEVIGGLQSLTIPLYDTETEPKIPLWHQDKRHVPHPDLNAVNIFVPFWHDAIKLLLPENTRMSDLQVIEEDNSFPSNTPLTVGDTIFVVGFPYGYSSFGEEQPTPVVLTRFVAAINIGGRHQEILLDDIGAPSMSGGPVFVKRESSISLLGLYTGLLYPDHKVESNEKVTALGTCSNMCLHLWGALPFVEKPDES